MALRFTCPHCDHSFSLTKMPAGKLRCPGCEVRFLPKRRNTAPEEEEESSGDMRKIVLAIALAGLALVLIVGGLIGSKIIGKVIDGWSPDAQTNNTTQPGGDPNANVPTPAPPPDPRPNPDPNPDPGPRPVPIPDPDRLHKQAVNKAIDKGVAYLKKELGHLLSRQTEQGYYRGVLALSALTLLECGVPASDPLVRQTADRLRESPDKLNSTYTVAPAILLFDKLGDKRDKDLILKLGSRLMASQLGDGTWSYGAAAVGAQPGQQDLVEQQLYNYMRTVTPRTPFGNRQLLGPNLMRSPVVRWLFGQPSPSMGGDNSNTQFAVLALWVARRHGLPSLPSLAFAAQRLRKTQNANGSWYYKASQPSWSASMTCAGLLGLGIGTVLEPFEPGKPKPDALDRAKDPAIEKAFTYLSDVIKSPGTFGVKMGERGKIIQADCHGDLYFLWSLERAAVIFGIETIGGQDWYNWASRIIVDAQQADGSWKEYHAGAPDTCFALLVLKRVNIVKDVKIDPGLTGNIKKAISIKEGRN